MNDNPQNQNMPRRDFLKVMPLAAAGFMVAKPTLLGAEVSVEKLAEFASDRRLNRWYEALRPTSRFQVLDGDWEMATLIGDRGDLWRKPDSLSKHIALPEISGGSLRNRALPDSKDLRMNWYQRTFQLGESAALARKNGDRIWLHLGGVAWQWSAWVNGEPVVTGCLDPMNSREVDVTELLRDDENSVLIAATDSHGLCEDLKQINVWHADSPPGVKGNFIAPAPEFTCDPLVWGEVELWVRPAMHTEDIFVRPDFRNRQLHVDLEIVGAADAEISIKIVDSRGAAQPVMFPVQRSAAAGQRRKITLSADWENPRLWDTEDPFLYFAEITLTLPASGALLEHRRVRFGFREVWIEGGDIMMNGQRLFLARHFFLPRHEHSVGGLNRVPAPPQEQWSSPLTLAGRPFEIIDPRRNAGKTCIMLAPDVASVPNVKPGDLLNEAKGVAVGREFDTLYSLHASAFCDKARDGEVQWRYILHYQDGSQAESSVRMNCETGDWKHPEERVAAKVARMGQAMRYKPVGLYVAKLSNPHPQKVVQSLDIVSAKDKSVSGIVALTTGKQQALQPVESQREESQTERRKRE